MIRNCFDIVSELTIPGKCIGTHRVKESKVINHERVITYFTWWDNLKHSLKKKYPRLFGWLKYDTFEHLIPIISERWVEVPNIFVYPWLPMPKEIQAGVGYNGKYHMEVAYTDFDPIKESERMAQEMKQCMDTWGEIFNET